ncbi:MAG: ATP-binding protein, partial [Bacilli bacterium]|nr:ATP-binding protein [Bacilli bacterium]
MDEKEKIKQSEAYTEQDIEVLEGLTPVRVRPGMYIGDTASKGLHHLVWEIVDNGIDEVYAGGCDTINVIIFDDNSVQVEDNGRGIPTGIHPKTGISTVETVFTVLHAGGKFGHSSGYKVSGGLHGVGASVVNALSTSFEVWTCHAGKRCYAKFGNGGQILEHLKVLGETEQTGTIIKFHPDPSIFTETIVFDYNTIKDRLRQLAFLNKSVTINFEDKRSGMKESFHYDGGLKEYVKFLNSDSEVVCPDIFYIEG